MLKIKIEVREINYEKCFGSLIPQLIEECRSNTEPTELEKMLVRLGPDTVSLVDKLLGFLDTDTRDQILKKTRDFFRMRSKIRSSTRSSHG